MPAMPDPGQFDLQTALAAAMADPGQGRLIAAESGYRKVAAAPKLGDALQGLGVLCLQSGRPDQAIAHLRAVAAALPRARIVHVMRDPYDTCLSCYAILFEGRLDFTYALDDLGRYCRSCLALMAHWRQVLPPGRMLEVRYESLVADFESRARRPLYNSAVGRAAHYASWLEPLRRALESDG